MRGLRLGQPDPWGYTQHLSATMYPKEMPPPWQPPMQNPVVVSDAMLAFQQALTTQHYESMSGSAAVAGQCAQSTSTHDPGELQYIATPTPSEAGADEIEDLPHKSGHAHYPHRLLHGFFDTYPDSRHGPARPKRPARTPCSQPTSAAE